MATQPDVDWLRAQIEEGASTRLIAEQTGVTVRTVRNWLHRHDLPLPSTVRRTRIPLDDIFDPYRQGERVSYTTSGEEDATYSDDIQVIQYDAEAMHFTDIGEIISFGS